MMCNTARSQEWYPIISQVLVVSVEYWGPFLEFLMTKAEHPFSLLLCEIDASASCFLEQGEWEEGEMDPHPIILIWYPN